MQPEIPIAKPSELAIARLSSVFLGEVQRAMLTTTILSLVTLCAVANAKSWGPDEIRAIGKSHNRLPGTESIAEGRSAMHDIFKRRHSVRSFQSRMPNRRDLEAILAAADSAPSAGALKSREMLLVADEATKELLVEAAHGQQFVGQAPVVMVFWSVPSRSALKYGARGRDLFALQDATIAASFAWLQAVASGLSACWVGAFDDEIVNRIFREKIEPDWRPVALLPVGYPAE